MSAILRTQIQFLALIYSFHSERPKLKWLTPKSHTLRLLEGDTLPEMCFNVIAGKPQPVVDILKLNNSQQSTEHPVKMHSKQNSSSVCLMSPPLSFKDSGDYSLVARNCLPPPSPPLNFTIQVQPYGMMSVTCLYFCSFRTHSLSRTV